MNDKKDKKQVTNKIEQAVSSMLTRLNLPFKEQVTVDKYTVEISGTAIPNNILRRTIIRVRRKPQKKFGNEIKNERKSLNNLGINSCVYGKVIYAKTRKS